MKRDFRVFLLCAAGMHGVLIALAWLMIRPTESRDVVHSAPGESLDVEREPAEPDSRRLRRWLEAARETSAIRKMRIMTSRRSRPQAQGGACAQTRFDTSPPASTDAHDEQEPEPDLAWVRAATDRIATSRPQPAQPRRRSQAA